MLIWYFSNNLDIYHYVGKLPEQHFSVWLFFNPGDTILFLLKFYEARISEWNIYKTLQKDSWVLFGVAFSTSRVKKSSFHYFFWCFSQNKNLIICIFTFSVYFVVNTIFFFKTGTKKRAEFVCVEFSTMRHFIS